ncbi:MAG TPA: hypothetical protein VHC44_19395, partial [Verrucomicrobiae bacterium]|nr:hypothetical protein [Verrucomicrobiae bacterium]
MAGNDNLKLGELLSLLCSLRANGGVESCIPPSYDWARLGTTDVDFEILAMNDPLRDARPRRRVVAPDLRAFPFPYALADLLS